MGIFFNRGFEYLIIIDNDLIDEDIKHLSVSPITQIGDYKFISVIPQKQTDTRLVTTRYFLTNEENWYHPSELKRLNPYDYEDLIITNDESKLIDEIHSNELICKHMINSGWYDINYICTTY
jgi:hypothetical protein